MRDPENWSANLDEIQPTLDVPFDGITVQIAPAYDAMMRRAYGEYTQPPRPGMAIGARRTHTRMPGAEDVVLVADDEDADKE